MPTCTIWSSDSPAGQNFCGECGAALGNRCPQCGADNPAGKNFRGDCGTALTGIRFEECRSARASGLERAR
ncbi:zinc ribbon domain-containing protein [bacterium]|nr:zinc ribbon domain-containing protein [bacterium]